MASDFITTLTAAEFKALVDQEPPIIIKPGPGGAGVASEPQVSMFCKHIIADQFRPPSNEQVGVSRWFVYRHWDETMKVKYLLVRIGTSYYRIDFPQNAQDFDIVIRYDV